MGLDRNLLRSDPPAHTRLRRLVGRAFTPGRIEQLRPRVREMADGLAARFLPRGEAELIGEFAFPLPLMVMMELLGMPLADWDEFQRWAQMTVPRGPGSLQEEMAGYTAIRGYFADLVARKTREPGGDDLLSALVAVRDEGRRLDEDEPPGMAWLLLTAGHTTTVDLIGSGVLALLRHPGQYAAVRADPSLLPAAIEEMVKLALTTLLTRFPGQRLAPVRISARLGSRAWSSLQPQLPASSTSAPCAEHPDG